MDNLTDVSFGKISEVCQKHKVPLFGFSSSNVEDGAILALSRDFFTGGLEAGIIAAEIINGKNPNDIAFKPVLKSYLAVNPETAKFYGIKIPDKIMKKAIKIIVKN